MRQRLVAGIDSSTQQTKPIVVALHGVGGTRPVGADALSVTAQQHTTIMLSSDNEPVHPAILWNDLRAAGAAHDLRRELGDDMWLDTVGTLPDAAQPVSRLRWIADHDPSLASRVEMVVLPHDWLTARVLGDKRTPTTDRSDASSTGYWSPHSQSYQLDLAERALGHRIRVPEILPAFAAAGTTRSGLIVAAGCGDNAATHLALDMQLGDLVISVGTSTTVSMRTAEPARDATGTIDTMADVRDGFIPIVAMLNGARVLAATARMLGLSLEKLNELAPAAPPDADGVVFAPYLDGERNPAAVAASGMFAGLSRRSMTPEAISRAVVLPSPVPSTTRWSHEAPSPHDEGPGIP